MGFSWSELIEITGRGFFLFVISNLRKDEQNDDDASLFMKTAQPHDFVALILRVS